MREDDHRADLWALGLQCHTLFLNNNMSILSMLSYLTYRERSNLVYTQLNYMIIKYHHWISRERERKTMRESERLHIW